MKSIQALAACLEGYFASNNGNNSISGTVTNPLSVRRISGMTDSGSGDYEVGISNAMANSDYGGGAAGRISGNISFDDGGGNSTTSVGIGSLDASGSDTDCNDCGVVIAGDLA